MFDIRAMEATVESSLATGSIVVLLCPCAPTVMDARAASRQGAVSLQKLEIFKEGRLSRSATAGLGVVAAHRRLAVGVDVEAVNSEGVFEDVRPLLHSKEKPWHRGPSDFAELAALWVRKEAVLKAFGVGLAVAPASIDTGGPENRWRAVTHALLGRAMVCSIDGPEGFVLSVAVVSRSAPITCFEYISLETGSLTRLLRSQ